MTHKVAPIGKLTIPRLELCEAHLLAELSLRSNKRDFHIVECINRSNIDHGCICFLEASQKPRN